MNTRTAHIARRPWGHDAYSNPMAISLPAEPFTIPPAATDETAPTALPVRDKHKRNALRGWRVMDVYERRVYGDYDEPKEVVL